MDGQEFCKKLLRGIISMYQKHKNYIKKYEEDIEETDWAVYTIPNNQKYMMILQNPRKIKSTIKKNICDKEIIKECISNLSKCNLTITINEIQKELKNWLLEDNKHFLKFFTILYNRKLLKDFRGATDYVETRFLKDFYVTDLFKFRVSTKNLDKNS